MLFTSLCLSGSILWEVWSLHVFYCRLCTSLFTSHLSLASSRMCVCVCIQQLWYGNDISIQTISSLMKHLWEQLQPPVYLATMSQALRTWIWGYSDTFLCRSLRESGILPGLIKYFSGLCSIQLSLNPEQFPVKASEKPQHDAVPPYLTSVILLDRWAQPDFL